MSLKVVPKNHFLSGYNHHHKSAMILLADFIHFGKQLKRNPHAFADARTVLIESAQNSLRPESFLDMLLGNNQRGRQRTDAVGILNPDIALEVPQGGGVESDLVNHAVACQP